VGVPLAVEVGALEDAQALVRGAIHDGADAATLRPWFTDVVSDHLLSYGHGAIYAQKAFQLLDRIGWDRADTVLPHLVPTIVYGTREDTLPYATLFHRGLARLDLPSIAVAAAEPDPTWVDDGRLLAALLGPDRTEAALAAGAAILDGASLDAVLDVVSLAVERAHAPVRHRRRARLPRRLRLARHHARSHLRERSALARRPPGR
jgi:hypothetical protein